MMTSTMNTDTRADARQARIAAIVSAATVREHLGQWARYSRLSTGEHQIVYRGAVYVGDTLAEAIRSAGGTP